MEHLSRQRIVVFGPFRLSPAERLVYAGAEKLEITNRAFDILLVLVTHPDEVVSHEKFRQLIWPNSSVEDVNLRVHIAKLRRILGEHMQGSRCIESVPGRGYRFVGKVLYEESLIGMTEDATTALPSPATRLDEKNDYGGLIGRWTDLEAVTRLLTQNRLVTITGAGGVGKSSLALAVMRAHCSAHSINATYVELSSVQSSELVPSALASALDVIVVGVSPLDAVISALREARMVLLIDCCERVLDSVASIAETILRAAPGVTILATSREPLRAHDEWVYRLQPLQTPESDHQVDYTQARQISSVRLFAERARSAVSHFDLTPGNIDEICEICRALDGLPLAIELAAARLALLGTADMLTAIDKRLSFLTHGRRTDLPRHQTLRSTIDWSYDTLSTEEKLALRRISIFKSVFDLSQATAVIEPNSDPLSDVLPLLSELVDKSLLSAAPGGNSGTFRLLDSTREYGVEKLKELGEFRETAHLHASFLCSLFTEPVSFQRPADTQAPLASDRRILDDVRSALDWAFSDTGDVEIGIILTWSSAQLFYQLTLFDEYRSRVNRALKFTERDGVADADAQYRLQLALAQADFLTQGLDRGVAPKAFHAALALAEQYNDTARQSQTLFGTIVMTVMGGDYDGAGELTKRLLKLARSRQADIPLYHRLEALVETQKGELASAIVHARQSLSLFAKSPESIRRDPTRYAHRPTVMALESRTLWQMGYVDDAVEVANECVQEALQLDHKLSLCCAVASGACPVSTWRGEIDNLRRYLEILRPLSREMSLINWQGQAQCYEYALPGHVPDDTPQFWKRFDHLPPTSHEILATVNGRFLTPTAIDRAKSGAAGYSTAEILRALGENLLASGTIPCTEAEQLFRSAIAIATRHGALSWVLRASISLAKLKQRQGESQEAEDLLNDSLDRFTQGHSTRDYQQASTLLVGIRHRSI